MANYLKHENQLIVWPVLKEVTENDLFQGNIGLRARYDMTNKGIAEFLFRGVESRQGKELSFILDSW